ncbi:MAG: DUF6843 domain-containing protein [Vicinamibacteria bacterium]
MGVSAATILLSGACRWRTADVYEIPEDFRGWIRIDYSVPQCPELEVSEGRRIIRIPDDGRLCTSSDLEVGVAVDEFFLVGETRAKVLEVGEPRDRLIWGWSNGTERIPGEPDKVFVSFFVGTEQQFEERAAERP